MPFSNGNLDFVLFYAHDFHCIQLTSHISRFTTRALYQRLDDGSQQRHS
jgi:hypothetical protein